MVKVIENASVSFNVEVAIVQDGHRLQALTPDEHGYYTGVPLMVLGISTDNNTYYTVDKCVEQMTDPKSPFNRRLRDGKLFGEGGHPNLQGLDHTAALTRLATIDDKEVACHYRKIRTDRTLPGGGTLVVGDVRPHGRYGAQLADSLRTPTINTAFSLRSLTKNTVGKDGLSIRSMVHLVTFDPVLAGGYSQAAKRYVTPVSGGTESYSVSVTESDRDALLVSEYSMESLSQTVWADLFKTESITRVRQQITIIPRELATLDKRGRPRSKLLLALRED